MVAYSFRPQFIDPIATLKKRQTVRGFRKRHARPGEAVQLFTAMRTRQCRKILTPDPVCVELRHILIAFSPASPLLISAIEIEGRALSDIEIEEFAIADGFGGALADGFARRRMGEFWLRDTPKGSFAGVVIRWEPQ